MDWKPQQAKGGKDFAFNDAMSKCKEPMMEIKFDGWRMLAFVEEDGVRMYSRTAKEYTGKVPHIEAEIARCFPVGSIIDGEIVDLEDQDCVAVTNVFGKSVAIPSAEEIMKLTYVAFDLLQLGDNNVEDRTLADRRFLLNGVAAKTDPDRRLFEIAQQHTPSEDLLMKLIEDGYEGAMVKCLQSQYKRGKRGHGWFKLKAIATVDMVIMELPVNGKNQFDGQVGHMIVGQYDESGNLVSRARVNPPDNETRLQMTHNPDEFIGRVMEMKHFGFQVDGFRHPTFIRWREDKEPRDCGWDNG